MHILELLSVASPGQCHVRLVTPGGTRDTSFAALWSLSARAGRAIDEAIPPGPVAGILTPSAEAIACFVGSLRAGRDFVSLPLPGRGQDLVGYVRQLRRIVELANVRALVVEAAYEGLLRSAPEPLPCEVVVAERLADPTATALRSDPEPGELIQFSSGTTGTPKGLRLTGTAIAASVESLLDGFGVDVAPEIFCAWLPLSHDMGLIGGLLGSWAGSRRTRPGYQYICISPEMFLARPLLWMETCAASGATVTAGPTFAYHILSRHLRRASGLDLHRLRACAVGAEPIAAETLEAFASAAGPYGFRETALCPAYGLAEATLAVSMVRPGEPWKTRTVSVEGQSHAYVSCGPIFDCVKVNAPDVRAGAGPIRISGPAMCSGTIPPRETPGDGWLDTGDLGVVADGELIVTGRSDDLLCFAGRNVFAWELEKEVSVVPQVRTGDCAVVADGRGRYVVLFERRTAADGDVDGLLLEIRRRLAKAIGIGPAAVGCLARGTLPKTPSGKIRRKVIAGDLGRLVESCTAYKEF
jgi:acyl-CoA synthetase (AMP-forming)/AMP-acid ligase II